MTVYDLLIFHGFVPNQEYQTQLLFASPQQPSECCSGILKLAQRWLLEFLTEAGSQPYRVSRGCSFLQAMRFGRLRNEDDVKAEFAYCRSQISQQLIEEEFDTMAADERYADVTLQHIVLLADRLQLVVQLTSQAGTTRVVSVPVSLSPIQTGIAV